MLATASQPIWAFRMEKVQSRLVADVLRICSLAVLSLSFLQPNAGDYTYSGMSDHGPLPVPRRGGDIAVLIECVNQTKQCSDDFLTDVIKKETIARSSNQQTDMSRKKFKGHPNKAV
jgi:hypothetical protein